MAKIIMKLVWNKSETQRHWNRKIFKFKKHGK